ncbi:conserved hypothetical protein (plasmid) [Borreliella burgdorferi CA-11.2A]|nr:conserved hypothetical protein [Borreliella burgdorferi WI91-23]ACN56172.1 conserved hypothetical protein [Borreliella burgdorferi CA-11.2A]
MIIFNGFYKNPKIPLKKISRGLRVFFLNRKLLWDFSWNF